MINFSNQAWQDYIYWQKEDKTNIEKINILIKDTLRHPFKGLGKPEPLRGKYKGYWSRRITRAKEEISPGIGEWLVLQLLDS